MATKKTHHHHHPADLREGLCHGKNAERCLEVRPPGPEEKSALSGSSRSRSAPVCHPAGDAPDFLPCFDETDLLYGIRISPS